MQNHDLYILTKKPARENCFNHRAWQAWHPLNIILVFSHYKLQNTKCWKKNRPTSSVLSKFNGATI